LYSWWFDFKVKEFSLHKGEEFSNYNGYKISNKNYIIHTLKQKQRLLDEVSV